jgi:hypothetical protein
MRIYDYPDALDRSETRAVFSSHYFCWDSERHFEIAKQYGFEALNEPREGTYRSYVGIDEKINRVHQYLKLLKFGYGRATDHACEDIRNGRLTRDAAKELVRRFDLQPLGDDYIDDFCTYLGYSRTEFVVIMERYRNRDIWQGDSDTGWLIHGHLKDSDTDYDGVGVRDEA